MYSGGHYAAAAAAGGGHDADRLQQGMYAQIYKYVGRDVHAVAVAGVDMTLTVYIKVGVSLIVYNKVGAVGQREREGERNMHTHVRAHTHTHTHATHTHTHTHTHRVWEGHRYTTRIRSSVSPCSCAYSICRVSTARCFRTSGMPVYL